MSTDNTTDKLGRPTVMTPEIISKLEEVFSIGGSDSEACFYAGIGKTTLYNYQQDHPEFTERKEALKERPVLKARQTIAKALDNPIDAWKYLEKKRKSEFGNAIDITSGGNALTGPTEADKELAKKLLEMENVSNTRTNLPGAGTDTNALGAKI